MRGRSHPNNSTIILGDKKRCSEKEKKTCLKLETVYAVYSEAMWKDHRGMDNERVTPLAWPR